VIRLAALLAGLIAAGAARAGTLDLPAPALTRGGEVSIPYRLPAVLSGSGTLTVVWTDKLGRKVWRESKAVTLDKQDRLEIRLDLRRAVAALNMLSVRLHLDDAGRSFDDEAEARFAAMPGGDPWSDYQIILWQPQPRGAYPALRTIGVSAGRLIAKDRPLSLDGAEEGILLANDLPWYEENIATDFFAAYHRFTPGKPNNWLFEQAKARFRDNPGSLEPFIREPSLEDPAARARTDARLTATVTSQKPFHPLYYSLADESGLAELSAYWDFDFSPFSLSGLRHWLAARYGSLEALNRQWDSAFARWDQVMPMTAFEALRHPDNVSAWADFREWMDASFANAAGEARDAVHAADPRALAALEGGQQPGWGGYDYSRLTKSVDLLELYDLGDNVDIVHSLAPALPVITTSFHGGTAESLRIWRELLHGNRGLILWDEESSFAGGDGTPGYRGAEMAPLFHEIRGGIGALLIASQPAPSPVLVHYSPSSQRLAWFVAQEKRGPDGVLDSAVADYPHDGFTALRQEVCDTLADLGWPCRFVDPAGLADARPRVLILPDSLALSDEEIREMKKVRAAGGTVIALGDRTGAFDEHGKRRAAPPSLGRASVAEIGGLVRRSGMAPRFSLITRQAGLEMTELRNGEVSLIGLIDRLGATGASPARHQAVLRLGETYHVYDLREGRELGTKASLPVTPPENGPVLLAVSRSPIPDFRLVVSPSLRRGGIVRLDLSREGPSPDQTQIFRVEIRDPHGKKVEYYSGLARGSEGKAAMAIPTALNDEAGRWTIAVTDVVTGRRHESPVDLSD